MLQYKFNIQEPIQYSLNLFQQQNQTSRPVSQIRNTLSFTQNTFMRRNASARIIHQQSTSHNNQNSPLPLQEGERDYKRSVYINEETSLNKKEKHTIFHSPYKNGKKNNQYQNPTFLSSDLFYPSDYAASSNPSTKPKQAIKPSPNDVRKKQLYEQRIGGLSASHSEARLGAVPQNNNIKKPPVLFVKDQVMRQVSNNQLLEKELHTLKAASNQRSLSRLKEKQAHSRQYTEDAGNITPVYLQRGEAESGNVINQRRGLIQHLKQALNYKKTQEQKIREEKKAEKRLIDAESQRVQAAVAREAQKERERARLLSEVYNQQMRQRW